MADGRERWRAGPTLIQSTKSRGEAFHFLPQETLSNFCINAPFIELFSHLRASRFTSARRGGNLSKIKLCPPIHYSQFIYLRASFSRVTSPTIMLLTTQHLDYQSCQVLPRHDVDGSPNGQHIHCTQPELQRSPC
jgi:hypothetical protein